MVPQTMSSPPGTPAERERAKSPLRLPLVICCFITACALFWLAVQPQSTVDEALSGAGDAGLAIRSTFLDTVIYFHDSHETAHDALKTVVPSASAFLVVCKGPSKPASPHSVVERSSCRRVDGQPFLSHSEDVTLPTTAINVAAVALEQATGRRLFPMRLETVDMRRHLGMIAGGVRPYAVWEAGSGLVLVDKALVQSWADTKVYHMIGSLSSHLFTTLADSLRTAATHVQDATTTWSDPITGATDTGSNSMTGHMGALLGPALSLAVAAAFATAPPLWFCIMCPAVLGLLCPLLINIALKQLAGYLCVHMALPDDQCFDLLLGALGLGFVLSLASAIPIFVVCRLQECAHTGAGGGGFSQGAGAGTLMGSLAARARGVMGRKWWGGGQGAMASA